MIATGEPEAVAASEAEACCVYGIVSADVDLTALPSDLVGIDQHEVGLVRHGDVAAVVGVISTESQLGRRADLLAYSRVLDAVAALGAVIPVRFGSVLLDGAEVVAELLAPNSDDLTEVLAGLEGRSQFNLRARYEEESVLAEVVTEHPEIAELREQTRDQPEDASYGARVRLGELVAGAVEAKRAADGEVVMDLMVPHAVVYNLREGGGLDHLIDVAFLVDDDRRDAFEAAAENVAAQLGERAKVRLVGPLAAYDFVPQDN